MNSILSAFNHINNPTVRSELLGGYFMPQVLEDSNKPSCVMCEFFMSRVKSWLEDGHTADQLEGELKEICNLLPGTVKV